MRQRSFWNILSETFRMMIRNLLESLEMHMDLIEKVCCTREIPQILAALWPNFLETSRFALKFRTFGCLLADILNTNLCEKPTPEFIRKINKIPTSFVNLIGLWNPGIRMISHNLLFSWFLKLILGWFSQRLVLKFKIPSSLKNIELPLSTVSSF